MEFKHGENISHPLKVTKEFYEKLLRSKKIVLLDADGIEELKRKIKWRSKEGFSNDE